MAGNIDIKSTLDSDKFIKSKLCSRDGVDEPLLFFNISKLSERHHLWMKHMPNVKPFYAVKCNNDRLLLRSLVGLGTGFDCASKTEIKLMMDLGVSPGDIIYANPCKPQSHISYALKKNVARMTFDNIAELHKTASIFPSAELVIRIRADSDDALVKLGAKFGCSVADVPQLLEVARGLCLNVVGVSFHVGSGCQSPMAYKTAIQKAHQVFELGKAQGFNFTFLDIGGGFLGNDADNDLFISVAKSVNDTIKQLFVDHRNLTVIAEPGRFFAASCITLATQIISKRTEPHREPMYYINDGVYGTFSGIIYENAPIRPHPLMAASNQELCFCSVWGPTCDSIDKIGSFELPEMAIGDWILFYDMGAYSIASSSGFNGFGKPEVIYFTEGPILMDEASFLSDSPPLVMNQPLNIGVSVNTVTCCS